MIKCPTSWVIGAMQMKTIIKYYFIPTSMAVIKDGKNKHGGKYASGKIKRCTLEGSRQTGHTVVVSQMVKRRVTARPNDSPPRCEPNTPKRNENTCPCKTVYAHVHRSAIRIRNKWGKPKNPLTFFFSIDFWIDEWNAVCLCNGTLFVNKREWSTIHATTWMNLENIMLIIKVHILYDYIYM